MKSIYFMDFIKDNFKDVYALEKVFIKNRQRKRLECNLKSNTNIFEMIYLENINNLKDIFTTYIVWSDSYIELGFSNTTDVSQIHYRWYNIAKEFRIHDEKILFEKAEYHPLQINFEGE